MVVRILLSLVFIALLFPQAHFAQPKHQRKKSTKRQSPLAVGRFAFASDVYDYGKVDESAGGVEGEFTFTNTGDAPITITDVATVCGCTVPIWPKEPVLPGATGFIRVTLKTENRAGPITKELTVISNASEPKKVLKLRGEIVGRVK